MIRFKRSVLQLKGTVVSSTWRARQDTQSCTQERMIDMVFKYSRSGVSYLRVCLIHLQAYTFSYAVGVIVFLPTLSPHSTIRLLILNVDDMIPKRTHLGSTNHISQSAQRIGRLLSVFTFCVRWRVWPYLREFLCEVASRSVSPRVCPIMAAMQYKSTW